MSLRATKKGIAFIYQKNDITVIANESSSEAIYIFHKSLSVNQRIS